MTGPLDETRPDADVLRSAWEAFGRGDLDAAVRYLHPEVRWYGADDPEFGGACRSRGDVVAFIRQALADGVSAELLDVHEAGGYLVAVVHTHAPADWEGREEPHGELVTVRDGLITDMAVYPTVQAALSAADGGHSA